MNKQRRELLASVVRRLDGCRADIESASRDEQDAYDGLPENLQESERAQQMEEAVDHLDEAVSLIEQATDEINQAT